MDHLYQAMESERDLPLAEQKAKEMGCLDTVERRAVHQLRQRLEKEPNVSTYDYGFDWKTDGIDISREDISMKQICSRLFTVVSNRVSLRDHCS